jgi:hypothetical protein
LSLKLTVLIMTIIMCGKVSQPTHSQNFTDSS